MQIDTDCGLLGLVCYCTRTRNRRKPARTRHGGIIQQIRREGKSVRDALIEAGMQRLRPIIMTAAATVFTRLPPAKGAVRLYDFSRRSPRRHIHAAATGRVGAARCRK